MDSSNQLSLNFQSIMMSENQYHCDLFTLTFEEDKLSLEFNENKKTIAKYFEHLNFCSCLLHSFQPNSESIWVKQKRLDFEIKGWPSNIEWKRCAELEFKGHVKDLDIFDFNHFVETLKIALNKIQEGKFAIGNNSHWEEYEFVHKGREIVGLCVLYDLEFHSRDELEIKIEIQYQPHSAHKKKNLPYNNQNSTIDKFYGDPSKVVDYLRNEGWTREGKKPTLIVERYQRQQRYKLTSRRQDLSLRVARTTIKKKWKDALFKLHNNTCRICHTRYEDSKMLSPDHRIPAIIEAEDLTDQNFKDKLMTLCIFCNQTKREFTKKVSPDYDWQTSPWAYPEKFELEKIAEEIKRYAKTHNLTTQETINRIIELINKEEK